MKIYWKVVLSGFLVLMSLFGITATVQLLNQKKTMWQWL